AGLYEAPVAEQAAVTRILDQAAALPAEAPPAPLPQSIGGCRVIRELGRGGMGAVYLAVQDSLTRPVAVKVLRPDLAADPSIRSRFLREGEALARVKADNVVDVYSAGQDGDQPYLIMECLKGATLHDWLSARPGPAPASDVCWVAKEVLIGL